MNAAYLMFTLALLVFLALKFGSSESKSEIKSVEPAAEARVTAPTPAPLIAPVTKPIASKPIPPSLSKDQIQQILDNSIVDEMIRLADQTVMPEAEPVEAAFLIDSTMERIIADDGTQFTRVSEQDSFYDELQLGNDKIIRHYNREANHYNMIALWRDGVQRQVTFNWRGQIEERADSIFGGLALQKYDDTGRLIQATFTDHKTNETIDLLSAIN